MSAELVPITEAARLLMLSRARIYQLAASGDLEKRGKASVTAQSVIARMFVWDGDQIIYEPLHWRFNVHRPAPSAWPKCGAKRFDDSLAVSSDRVPPELHSEPELAAKIARLALDFADR